MMRLLYRANVAYLDDYIIKNRFGNDSCSVSFRIFPHMKVVYWDEISKILILASSSEKANRKRRIFKLCKIKGRQYNTHLEHVVRNEIH